MPDTVLQISQVVLYCRINVFCHYYYYSYVGTIFLQALIPSSTNTDVTSTYTYPTTYIDELLICIQIIKGAQYSPQLL